MLFYTRRVVGVRFYSDRPPADVPRLPAKQRKFMGERENNLRIARWLTERGRREELVRGSLVSLSVLTRNAEVLRSARTATCRARQAMALQLVQAGVPVLEVWETSGVSYRTFRSWLVGDLGKATEHALVPEGVLEKLDRRQDALAHARALEALDFDVLRLQRRVPQRTQLDREFNGWLEKFTELHRDWAADNEEPYVYHGIGTEELDEFRDQLGHILYTEALERHRA